MSKLKWMAGLVSATSLLISISATATTLEQMKFDDMVDSASACIVGDAVSSRQEKINGQVVTLTTFNVTKTAFGSTADTITVQTAGGASQLGRLEVSEVVAGSPRFFTGTESVMLLSQNSSSGNYSIIGFNQGLFPVGQGAGGLQTVQLPREAGGQTSLDNALNIIRQQRVLDGDDDVAK